MLSLPTSGDQGTAEWRADRAGCVTGSRFGDVMAKLVKTPSKEAKSRRDYRLQLVAERLTGLAYENFSSKEVEWGKFNEPLARLAYEMSFGLLVEQVGFQPHPEIEWVGVSPDGLVLDSGVRGIIEIKCPYNPGVHLETYLRGSDALANALLGDIGERREEVCPIPPEHMPQCQGNMWVTGAEFCDFISFDSRYPEHMQLYVHRVKRDEPYIANLKAEVLKFLAEVEENVAKLLIPGAGTEVEEKTKSPQLVEA